MIVCFPIYCAHFAFHGQIAAGNIMAFAAAYRLILMQEPNSISDKFMPLFYSFLLLRVYLGQLPLLCFLFPVSIFFKGAV